MLHKLDLDMLWIGSEHPCSSRRLCQPGLILVHLCLLRRASAEPGNIRVTGVSIFLARLNERTKEQIACASSLQANHYHENIA